MGSPFKMISQFSQQSNNNGTGSPDIPKINTDSGRQILTEIQGDNRLSYKDSMVKFFIKKIRLWNII